MMMTNPHDDMVDDLFAQARQEKPAPSQDLMARVLADADLVQPVGTSTQAPRPRPWARLLDMVGGWPAVGGLTAATIAGVWVGVAPPAPVEDLTAALIGDEVSIALFSTDLVFDAGALSDG